MVSVALETTPAGADILALREGLRAFNVAAVPELLSLPGDDFNVVATDEHGDIIGGAVVEADLGWLFVDTLWVADAVRGQGYGSRIMNAVEQVALRQGIHDVWLMTTDFQALDFYPKIGYRQRGANDNRPAGHRLVYLTKTDIQPAPYDLSLSVELPPNPETLQYLTWRLIQSSTVTLELKPLAVFVRDENRRILGGLAGNAFWDWFDLRYLWLSDALRGQGYGKKLLELLEAECARRGLRGISSDTLDWQALPFYQKHGFTVNFSLPDRPPGHISYFIQKILARER